MRHHLIRRLCCGLGLAAALTGPAAAASADGASAGMIKRITGTVTVERDGATLPAAVGMRLQPGDRLVTGVPGGVGVVLSDDSLVTAGPGSQVVLSLVQFDATTHEGSVFLRLLKGALHMVTGLIGRQTPQNVKVETPMAVLGVRGTEFIIETRGGQP